MSRILTIRIDGLPDEQAFYILRDLSVDSWIKLKKKYPSAILETHVSENTEKIEVAK